MIICVCKAVSDRHIRAAVADGATCIRELTRELGVGTGCGKCVPEAKAVLSACVTQCAKAAGHGSGLGSPAFFPAPAAEFATG